MDWIAALLDGPLLDGPPEVGPWWSLVRRALSGDSTLQHAALGGLAADRLGLAFVAGYQAALARLLPERPHGAVVGVAFTEAGGVHPRAIRAALTPEGQGWRLSGEKTFVTCGPLATHLLVVASTGRRSDGRNKLRTCLVAVDAAGVTLTAHAQASFVPEVPHGSVSFADVLVTGLLPGDGYDRWLKAFRTVEDVHVHAALLGHLVRVGRQAGWPAEVIEAALVPLLALDTLAAEDPVSPIVHRALGGAMEATRAVLAAAEPHWPAVDAEVRERWERDRPLLKVAGKARAARLVAARG